MYSDIIWHCQIPVYSTAPFFYGMPGDCMQGHSLLSRVALLPAKTSVDDGSVQTKSSDLRRSFSCWMIVAVTNRVSPLV